MGRAFEVREICQRKTAAAKLKFIQNTVGNVVLRNGQPDPG